MKHAPIVVTPLQTRLWFILWCMEFSVDFFGVLGFFKYRLQPGIFEEPLPSPMKGRLCQSFPQQKNIPAKKTEDAVQYSSHSLSLREGQNCHWSLSKQAASVRGEMASGKPRRMLSPTPVPGTEDQTPREWLQLKTQTSPWSSQQKALKYHSKA